MGYSRTLTDGRRSKNGNRRDKRDYYPTPEPLVRAILSGYASATWHVAAPKMILDPGAGTGAFGDVARQIWPHSKIVGIDNFWSRQSSHYDLWRLRSYLDPGLSIMNGKFDLIIGNPPFKYAQRFVEIAHEHAKYAGTIIFLLRLAFLESAERVDFFKKYPPIKVSVLVSRPSFNGSGQTDATAYAVFQWNKEFYRNPTFLTWLNWKTMNRPPEVFDPAVEDEGDF